MPGALVSALCAVLATASGDPAPPPTASPPLRLEPRASAARADRDLATLALALPREPRADAGEPAPDGARVARLRRWHRALEWSTAGALVVTSTLGTLAAIDQPTAFGDGRCQTGGPVLGTYGCDRGLSTLHGSSGVVSALLYTATGVLGLAIPADGAGESRPGWQRALGFVHLGGIAIQPVLGLVSAFPQVIGVRNSAPGDPFPRDLRTAHVLIGYLTTAAFVASIALE
jgi:hypothetical protein